MTNGWSGAAKRCGRALGVRALTGALLVCGSLVSASAAATLKVKTTRDAFRSCSLREAFEAVDRPGVRTPCGTAGRASNTIVLRPGHYQLSLPPSGVDDNTSGDLDLAGAGHLTVTGAGSRATVIDASGLHDRVLSIAPGANVTLMRLTIRGGQARNGGSTCASPGSNGGGIFNAGTLVLRSLVLAGNTAGTGGPGCSGGNGGTGGSGGGIYSSGRLTLVASTVRSNTAGAGGPGGSTAGVGGGGGAGGAGGGIYSQGALSVSASTLSGNHAGAGGGGGSVSGPGGPGGAGGGIAGALGGLSLINSTLTGNVAGAGGGGAAPSSSAGAGGGGAAPSGSGGAGGNGGAVEVSAEPGTLVNDTVADNGVGRGGPGGSASARPGSSGTGGGLFVLSSSPRDSLRLTNTILASNSGGGCAGSSHSAIVNGGHNLSFGDGTCPGAHGNPKLGRPRDNGGPTQTLALRRGSAAINRIPRKGAHCPATDQRGVRRPQRGRCDIGAFEFAVPEITLVRPRNRGSYEHDSRVRARFRCTEGGIESAIARCKATVRSGHLINTGSVGVKRFRVIAVDKSGNRRVKTVRYRVWAYVNPLRDVSGLGPFRIDMGVDYSGSGPLLALGDAKITFASNNDGGPPSCWGITCWPGGGAVVYRLTDGPFAGKYVYYAERVTATVRTGQRVRAGQQVAIEHLGSPNIEIGWGSGRGPETLAIADGHQCTCGDPGGWSAIEGRNFNSLLVLLGAPSGFLQPGVPSQSMPWGWPALPARVNSRLISRSLEPMAEGVGPR